MKHLNLSVIFCVGIFSSTLALSMMPSKGTLQKGSSEREDSPADDITRRRSSTCDSRATSSDTEPHPAPTTTSAPATSPNPPQQEAPTVGQTGLQLASALSQVGPPALAFVNACGSAAYAYAQDVALPALGRGLHGAAILAASALSSTSGTLLPLLKGGPSHFDRNPGVSRRSRDDSSDDEIVLVVVKPKKDKDKAKKARERKSEEEDECTIPFHPPERRDDRDDDHDGGSGGGLIDGASAEDGIAG